MIPLVVRGGFEAPTFDFIKQAFIKTPQMRLPAQGY